MASLRMPWPSITAHRIATTTNATSGRLCSALTRDPFLRRDSYTFSPAIWSTSSDRARK